MFKRLNIGGPIYRSVSSLDLRRSRMRILPSSMSWKFGPWMSAYEESPSYVHNG